MKPLNDRNIDALATFKNENNCRLHHAENAAGDEIEGKTNVEVHSYINDGSIKNNSSSALNIKWK